MSQPRSGWRVRAGVSLLWLAIASLILATIAVLGGGFTLRAASPRISVHTPVNPLIVAAVLAPIGCGLTGRWFAAQHLRRANARVDRVAPWLGVGLSVAVFAFGVTKGSFAAAGADASGYLSQARLWQAGSLRVQTPLSGTIGLVDEGYAFTPLGYRPAAEPGWIVPTYPPGYPMMMALARMIGGEGAEHVVVPACAGGLIVVTFALGQRIGGAVVGLLAAAMMSVSPTQLFQAAQPMSDVPAAFWWSSSVLLLANPSLASTAAAGGAAAIAGIVRPNLFALVPLMVVVVAWMQPARGQRFIRAAAFAAIPLAAAIAFIQYQRTMYGGTTETGYGSLGQLFSFDYVLPNYELYWSWLALTHTPFILLGIAAPAFLARGDAGSPMERSRAVRLAWSLLAIFVGTLAFYCLYFVFDNWTYVRFLLPALPGLFVLTAVVLADASRRLPPALQVIALLVLCTAVLTWGIVRAQSLGVFGQKESDRRYVDAARFSQTLPDAVFLAVQHSGSLSYYTGRPILRWDSIEPADLDTAIEHLLARGRHVYAVVDDWEEPQLRARLAGTRTLESMSRPLATAGVGARAVVFGIRP